MAILFKLSKQTEKIIAHRLTKNGKIEINRKGNQIGQKFFLKYGVVTVRSILQQNIGSIISID
jgi:hypothetical protein